jgi:hypothetical protein
VRANGRACADRPSRASLAQVSSLFSFAYGIASLILAASVHESTAAQGATT